jgi:hypothetical protein
MAFAEDLLKQSFLLLNKESKEASANGSRADTRDYLAQAFEHRTMKQACI